MKGRTKKDRIEWKGMEWNEIPLLYKKLSCVDKNSTL